MDTNWIEMTRTGGAIQRFHTLPTIGDQSIAAHSFGVAVIATWIVKDPSKALLLAALYHDLAEQATGDVPAHVKWGNPDLTRGLKEVEERFNREYQLGVNLNAAERLVLKWADMLELLFYCKEQRQLGNRGMNIVFARGVDFLRELKPVPRGVELLNYLLENYDG